MSVWKEKLLANYAVFKHRTFLGATLTVGIYALARSLRITVMGWYLYDVTGNPVHLGFLALCEGIPYICSNPFGAYLSDRMSRRLQTLILIGITFILTLWLSYLVHVQVTKAVLLQIYATFMLFGLSRGLFASGALQTLIALTVPKEQYQTASAWYGTLTQAGMILGPITAGLLYAVHGPVVANIVVVPMMVITFFCMMLVTDVASTDKPQELSFWQDLTQGFRYIFSHQALKATVLLDFIAVVFGGVTGLLPVFAKDVLHLGPDGLGYLRASIQAGSICAGLYLAHYPMKNYVGRQYLYAVMLFGLCLLGFAFSTLFWLSMALLFLSGFFDWYGAVIRQTITRLLTPEQVIGRVTGARVMFAITGNELSTFESAVLAGWIGAVPSVVVGVVITWAAAGLVRWKAPVIKDITMSDLLKS